MQGVQARGANAYIQTHVQSRSPLELVVMLYDGAVRFMTEARMAMEQNDLGRKRSAMSCASGSAQSSITTTRRSPGASRSDSRRPATS